MHLGIKTKKPNPIGLGFSFYKIEIIFGKKIMSPMMPATSTESRTATS